MQLDMNLLLALDALLHGPVPPDDERIALTRACAEVADASFAVEANFWDAIASAEAKLVEALLDGRLHAEGAAGDAALDALLQTYRDTLRSVTVKPAELDSVIVQMDLLARLLDALASKPGGSEHRAAERLTYARSLLRKGFDFERDESLTIDRKDQPWPATEADSLDLWRKRVKNDWLRLKLAGQDDAAIRKVLDKRYDSAAKRLGKISSADAFQAFMNAYTMAIEMKGDETIASGAIVLSVFTSVLTLATIIGVF